MQIDPLIKKQLIERIRGALAAAEKDNFTETFNELNMALESIKELPCQQEPGFLGHTQKKNISTKDSFQRDPSIDHPHRAGHCGTQ